MLRRVSQHRAQVGMSCASRSSILALVPYGMLAALPLGVLGMPMAALGAFGGSMFVGSIVGGIHCVRAEGE